MSLFYKKPPEPEDEGWLITYADAITQMMCFFVLLLSISQPIQSKFEEAKKGMVEEFAPEEKEPVKTPFTGMQQQFFTIIEKYNKQLDMGVGQTDKGIFLEIGSGTFFTPGSAEFKPEALPLLEDIVKAIVNFSFDVADYSIQVEGHTDDSPISSVQFPSNWELSAARSSRVVRFLAEKGVDAYRLQAIGMGDTRPKVPNRDQFGAVIPENQEINRRVVVRIERRDD